MLATGCALLFGGTLAGCAGDGSGDAADTTTEGDAASDGDGGGGAEFGGWLSDTSNYDGVVDRTGESEVTVDVGVEGNTADYAFGPAAVRVSTGTTVVWEWTGRGGLHNVAAVEGASFESQTVEEAGHTYTQTFEEAGVVKYECTPHASLGMKGVVEVVE